MSVDRDMINKRPLVNLYNVFKYSTSSIQQQLWHFVQTVIFVQTIFSLIWNLNRFILLKGLIFLLSNFSSAR